MILSHTVVLHIMLNLLLNWVPISSLQSYLVCWECKAIAVPLSASQFNAVGSRPIASITAGSIVTVKPSRMQVYKDSQESHIYIVQVSPV